MQTSINSDTILSTILSYCNAESQYSADAHIRTEELGFDSVSTMQLISALEEQYGISITDTEAFVEHFEFLDTLICYIQSLL